MSDSSRSNDSWIADLRRSDPAALRDLRTTLTRGLTLGLKSRADLDSSDIEDFVQDASMKVLEKLDSFRGDSRFTTWANAIGIRVALTALRKKSWGHRSLDEIELDGATERGAGPAAEATKRDLIAALDRAIDDSLTERQRTLIRAELSGMPTVVIAERMNSNANALYKLYHDARKKLRTALEDAGFSEEDVRSELSTTSG